MLLKGLKGRFKEKKLPKLDPHAIERRILLVARGGCSYRGGLQDRRL